MKAAAIISLGFLFVDGCTITLDKQYISVQKNEQEIIKGTRNKKTGMCEVPLEIQQSETVVNNIMAQTSKPELAQYLHAALFSPTKASLSSQSNKLS